MLAIWTFTKILSYGKELHRNLAFSPFPLPYNSVFRKMFFFTSGANGENVSEIYSYNVL